MLLADHEVVWFYARSTGGASWSKKKLCLSEPAAGSCFVIGQCFSYVDAKEAEEGQKGADLQETQTERS